MDFAFNSDQDALKALAQKAFANLKDPEAAWTELARSGLSGVAISVERGGSGLGAVELGLVLEQAGRAAAAPALVPALLAAAAVGRFGSDAQAARLDRVVSGEAVITTALHEAGADLTRPGTRAERDGDGFRLRGTKLVVPALDRAEAIVVSARAGDEFGLFLVAADAAGLRREAGRITDDSTVHQVHFDGVAATRLGGADAPGWLLDRLSLAWSAYELGIAARQLEMTAEHALKRQQFGKPIGLFQAVGQRAADMHIDVEALRLAVWQAAFFVDDGRSGPLLAQALATAAFWATDAGARVAAGSQHIHGGIGFDRAYPLYRYFLAAKRVELELGGAHRLLARLGKSLAAEETT